MSDGLLMFAKYAFPPNTLQLCGPSENKELFELLSAQESGPDLRRLLLQFNGAFPYLRLIAQSNGIKDEFDKKVVEAYWLGNAFLKKVLVNDLYKNIESRFKKNTSKKDWFWLVSESLPDAKPFHGFHVFDIYRRAGLLRSGETKNVLETIDKCRISWGKVESVGLADKRNKFCVSSVLVKYFPLELQNGKLAIGAEKERQFFATNSLIKKGDEVSLHWDYICDNITQLQRRNLIYWTNYHLKIANQTM